MYMRKRPLVTLLSLLMACVTAMGQAIGQWKAYLAYHEIQDLEKAGNVIYVQASDNLYAYNTNDNSVQTFSKADCLNDCQIAHIKYNATAKKLIIVYTNYNIDLLADNGEAEILTDYQNNTLAMDKTVNDIYMNGYLAYLSTGFGIVKLNVKDAEISDTYNLGFPVNYTYIEGDHIYAASSSAGLYQASLTANLVDKSQWSRVGDYTQKQEEDKQALREAVKNANPGGPWYNHFGMLKIYHDKIYSCGRGYDVITDLYRPGCIQVLEKETEDWQIYPIDEVTNSTGVQFVDVSALAIDPLDERHVFAGGRTGLYEFQDGLLTQYHDYTNSPIESAFATDKNYQLVQDAEFDNEGNLWLLNSMGENHSLLEYTKDKEWISHHQQALVKDNGRVLDNLRNIFIDSRGLMWFVNDNWERPGIFCYNRTTDELKSYTSFYNQNGNILEVQRIFCVAEDREHHIWFGTNVGPLMLRENDINSGENAFQQVIVPRNDGSGLGDYLLANISVTDIAIDGGNRKWFATMENGVYLIDNDNFTELEHFQSVNSPLLADYVESIAIDSNTGMVYFGTEKGLCSYAANVTEPVTEMNDDTTYAYPNPVRPNYTGPITITGLTYNADVKIVSSSGQLVAKGRSTGGIYVWDGCDMKGKPVASGVYMVQTATQDGDKGTVCKVAIVR